MSSLTLDRSLEAIDPITQRPSLVEVGLTPSQITEIVARPLEWSPPRGWYVTFSISLGLLGIFGLSLAWLLWEGVGIWGNNHPVGWGFPIINFVFWVGIGHAGTLISAVLFLFRQRWRTSINRTAEAMTLFAVLCALIFPAIHTGRPWVAAYWLLPIPNQMDLWPQFRSPLVWDVFAVSIYFMVSALFWYVGLIPDLATLRDRASGVRARVFGVFALGWRNSQRHWRHWEKAYLLLAGLATPLVISVHSVVSFDFAVSKLPGWHTTIFPPYFVA
jgi:molybdopterin-containing oxidoreductase family membrane subunit